MITVIIIISKKKLKMRNTQKITNLKKQDEIQKETFSFLLIFSVCWQKSIHVENTPPPFPVDYSHLNEFNPEKNY